MTKPPRQAQRERRFKAGLPASLVLTLAATAGCAEDFGRWYADELKHVACSRGDRIQDCRHVPQPEQPEPQSRSSPKMDGKPRSAATGQKIEPPPPLFFKSSIDLS